LKLQDRVTFTGALAHDEVPSVVRQFDVALAPYPKLNHDFYFSPLKLFEYMACGIPVAASDTGQIAEVISHGNTGLLHTPDDLEALAANCHQLLKDPKLRKKIGRQAAGLVARDFTWDGNARRVVSVAREIIDTKRSAA
jgi:glycosyltransferase involved in cell wall biosynthesis